MQNTKILVLLLIISLTACNRRPEIDHASMLDGNQIFDLSIAEPERYLVSAYLPNPTEQQKDTPVIITAHGYSATTFEWDELREHANSTKTFYVSQVLLGGHGRTYDDFKESTWTDWQQPIMDEYKRLSDLGYRNISLAGSSTGATLIIQMIKSGFFDAVTTPKAFFLIDPIIVSGNRMLYAIDLLGPLLGYSSITLDESEQGKWYNYRPQETLKELLELIVLSKKDLEKGIKLPANSTMKVYKSKVDKVADPTSATLIHKGVRTANDQEIQLEMIDSELHVFTRLNGRKNLTSKDSILKSVAFSEIETQITQ